jgi:hypothetical protein
MKMVRASGFVLILAMALTGLGRAVETGSTYDTTAPNGTTIPNWETGWAQPPNEPEGTYVTGWNYVGVVFFNGGSASGAYLGNGWVLTAGHVGIGNIVLGGNTYQAIAGSSQSISNASGTADLCLYRINTTSLNNGTVLNLPPLILRTSNPVAFAYGTTGSSVILIGYGGGQGYESWGINTITQINQPITPGGYTYISNDFLTATGTTTSDNPHGPGSQSVTNNAQLVGADSGGGDFIYNAATGQWELAGINEVMGTFDSGQGFSGFVQVNTYASQINSLFNPPSSDSPTMPLPGLWIMACLLLLAAARSLGLKAPNPGKAGAR